MKKIVTLVALLCVMASVPRAAAQVAVGDDLKMNLGGVLTAGYSGAFGEDLPSNHGLNLGGSAQLTGSYYNPNFLNFSVSPYYNQSRNDSGFQSLTDATGVSATANLFTGSRYPGYVSYDYSRNSTGIFGLVGTPNFTTIGNTQGFGIGWSALIPGLPTLSVSYSQGNGSGNIYGTNEESSSSTKTLNVRSSYSLAGWNLNGYYTLMKVDSKIPLFLGGEIGNDFSDSTGNNLGFNGFHRLPWNGTIALSYNYSTYSGNFGSLFFGDKGNTDYTTNTQTALLSFHPTTKLTLFTNETFTDNLNGYFYQNLINGGSGVPIMQTDSAANSFTLSSGLNYLIMPHLYTQAQITYYDQTYLGKTYNGSYVSGTLGYNKRILDTFTVAATVIESSNQFANNSLGFIANVNAFHHLGAWEASAGLNYAQNVQTILVTYTTSYYNYNANLHRRLGRGKQWTGAYNGSHTGFSQYAGNVSKSDSFSTSLALRRLTLTANYVQSSGQSLLTSTGIQPIQPTPPILPTEGLIVYNGKGYGGSIGFNPTPRLNITGTYSHATSDTLSNDVFSQNRTDIYYTQLQYRLRQLNVLAGYTRFSQGISAAGTPLAAQNSYFIGVSRWINFF